MKIIATENMKKAITETMDSDMNICYLINRGNLTWEEREEIILEYINRLFSTLLTRLPHCLTLQLELYFLGLAT